MTTHVLIACSKLKSITTSDNLIWKEKTTITSWSQEWLKESELVPAYQLYSGRSFQEQYKLCRENNEFKPYILSAGGGLIEDMNAMIPSYDATLQSKSKGPNYRIWHSLPFGGLKNIILEQHDVVVSFAPPEYHRALLEDKDIARISSNLIVASTSPLASISSVAITIHPRAKEVLRVASVDLNTALLGIYISKGIPGFEKLQLDCEKLPSKIIRKNITDEELYEKVKTLKHLTQNDTVRYLRDELSIKASYERIVKARKHVLENSK